MATHALAVPAAAISLVDEHRQFYKSIIGAGGDLPQKRQAAAMDTRPRPHTERPGVLGAGTNLRP